MPWTLLSLSALLSGLVTSHSPTLSTVPATSSEEGPCRIYNSRRSADCLGRQLDRIPWRQLPSTLEQVDLSYNKLQMIHAEDFHNLPRLQVLLLQFNVISHIDEDAFKHNPVLEHLNIFNNSLHEIPFTALMPLTNLKKLYMSNNLYKQATLDEGFSKFVKLQVLSMGGSLVMGLKKGDFQPLKNIKLMSFAIKCTSNLSYYELGSLEVIQTQQMGFDMAIDQRPEALPLMLSDIANKTFSAIQFRNLFEFMYFTGTNDIFYNLRYVTAYQLVFHRGKFNENLLRMALMNLQEANSVQRLTLQYISNPDVLRFDWRFTWFDKVKELSLQYVYFNSVPCDAWAEMGSLEVLDVSNNRLVDSVLYNKRCDYTGSAPHLRIFNLSTNDLVSLKELSYLTKGFERLEVLDLSNNKLGSAEGIDDCVWKPNITRLIAHDNQFVSEALKCLPTTVQFLDLSNCGLDQLDLTFFDRTTQLTELLLSGNKIKFIPPHWRSASLQILSLDGNSFGVISVESFQEMPRLSNLSAGNNPYHCTCELHAFIQQTQSQGKVKLMEWPENYRCYHPEPFLNTLIARYFPPHMACDIRLVILISVAVTTIVVMILMLICHIFNIPWYTRAVYQIVRAKYRAHKEKAAGEGEVFVYHAFISYSHSDADWVRDQLLPCLENNRNPYRLCIHERDFMPGKWIIDNIIDNIESSRKVIFVLSRHFVNSEWCNYELYFAHQRAMGKTFSDVILVLMEPMDPKSLPSKYCKLKKMLSTKTYLEWPEQPKQQSFFWEQLKSVLGKPSLTRDRVDSARSRVSSEDGVSVIDLPPENHEPDKPPDNVAIEADLHKED
ncbi:hypothetical protein CRUP_033964, partial [Coryphaenoides rupestris]